MLKYNYEYSRILEQRNIKINQPSEILCRMLNLPANIQTESWEESLEEVESGTEPDINGVPQTLWRGERLYLDNIDEVGQRGLSTSGHERHGNNYGALSLARDKNFASKYAISTDGVKFYDGALPKE